MTVESPAISVLMSVYDSPIEYLDAAVGSILDQTFDDFEFVIVDDGSGETTCARLRDYAVLDRRVRLHRLDRNIGLTKALNEGLAFARGRYVARQDADDLSRPERLAAQFQFLESNPDVVAVGTNAELIDQRGQQIGRTRINTEMSGILRRNILIHGSMMFRKKSIDQVGGYDERMRLSQDYELYLRMMRIHSMKLALVEQVLYTLRQHPNSLSSKKRLKQLYFSVLAKVLTIPGHIGPIRRNLFFGLEFVRDLVITHKMLLPSLIRWRWRARSPRGQ